MNEWRLTQQGLSWWDGVLFRESTPGALDLLLGFTEKIEPLRAKHTHARVGLPKETPPEVDAVSTVPGILHSVTGDLC